MAFLVVPAPCDEPAFAGFHPARAFFRALSRRDRFGEHPWVMAEQLLLLPALYRDGLHEHIIPESLEQENCICHTCCMQSSGKGVLFDLDGTLVNTISDIQAAINAALAASGVAPIDEATTKTVVGRGLANALRGALGPALDTMDTARFDELYRILISFYEAHPCEHSKPYPGVSSLLRNLVARGVQVGVLSNKADVLVRMIIRRLFPSLPFALIQGMEASLPHKPDPKALSLFLNATGLGRDEMLYVGDSEVDWQFAKASGCRVALVSWGFRGRDALGKLDSTVICDTIAELEERIDAI